MTRKCAKCCPGPPARVPQAIAKMVEEKGGLEAICASVPDPEHLSSEVEMHKAMSDAHRLMVLHALSCTDLCPCLLKSITGLADSKLSYHLSVLEMAGLIEWQQDGQWRIYSLTAEGHKVLDLPEKK